MLTALRRDAYVAFVAGFSVVCDRECDRQDWTSSHPSRQLSQAVLHARLSACSITTTTSCCSGSSWMAPSCASTVHNALGSARETGACLDVAAAFGYVENLDAELLDRLDRVRATLVRNVAVRGGSARRQRSSSARVGARSRSLSRRERRRERPAGPIAHQGGSEPGSVTLRSLSYKMRTRLTLNRFFLLEAPKWSLGERVCRESVFR